MVKPQKGVIKVNFIFGRRAKTDNVLHVKNIIFGTLGSGKNHHPWDCLNTCACGKRPWLMYDVNKPYHYGGKTDPVFAYCPNCGRNTEKADIVATIENWNMDY